MQSGNLGFFMVEYEMKAVVDQVLLSRNLIVYREAWDGQPLKPVFSSDQLVYTAREREHPETLFIGQDDLPESALDEHPRPAARYGLVSLDLCGRDGSVLLLGSLGFKADPAVAAITRRTFRSLSKLICGQAPLAVVARSLLDGASAPARAVTASEGAKLLAARGGLLRQRGVANIEHFVA